MFLSSKLSLPQKPQKIVSLVFFSINLLILGSGIFWINSYRGKLPPGTTINQVRLGGLTQTQALTKLNQIVKPPKEFLLIKKDKPSLIASHEIGLSYAFEPLIQNLILPKNFSLDLLKGFLKEKEFLVFAFPDREKLKTFIEKKLTSEEVEPAWVELKTTNLKSSLVFHQTKSGLVVDKEKTALTFDPTSTPPRLRVIYQPSPKILSQTEIKKLLAQARNLVGKKITLENKRYDQKLTLNDQELIGLLAGEKKYFDKRVKDMVVKLSQKINRPAKNAVFEYDSNTLRVDRFEPDQPGLELDSEDLSQQIKNKLTKLRTQNQATIELKLKELYPTITLAKTNNLGINELLGVGESFYFHSIPSRVHNVDLAAKTVNNLVLKPGQEFSFNQAIGEVSAKTGYKSAYIIKNGRTEKGDGGGVCQVSTTLFRAVLDAGLKVTKRLPHSYRVSYYELNSKPGIDATVFDGEVDLRFINDTQNHILIRSVNEPEKRHLRYEIYGTSDGRTAQIINHKTWGWRPPLPPEYIEDPSLPRGEIRQIDWPASGIKARFTNLIKDKTGKIIREDTYYSNYQPWSAKYLVGTK